MMMSRLQFAFGVVLAFVRCASGEISKDMPLEDLVDHFISTFDRNMHEGNAAQMLGASERRLAAGDADKETKDAAAGKTKKEPRAVGTIPAVTYKDICEGSCWTDLKTEFTESLKVMDSKECKKEKNEKKAKKVKEDKSAAKEKVEKKKKSDDDKKAKADKAGKGNDGAAGAAAGDKGAAAGGDADKAAKKKECLAAAKDDAAKAKCDKPAGAAAGNDGAAAGGDADKAAKKKKECLAAAKDDAEKAKCNKPAGGQGRLLEANKEKKAAESKTSACIFDLCDDAQVKEMCTGNATGNFSFDKFEMDSCKRASAMFICKSVCKASCKDSKDMKSLLCGSTGKEGSFESDAGGGSLKKMFNGICSKKAEATNEWGDNPLLLSKYCYDLIKTDLAAGRYDAAADKAKEGKMPDPCATDCASTMGKAVKALGCCFPTLMEVQKKYNVIKRESGRFVKATAVQCAKETAFSACTTGQLTPSKSKQFMLNTTGSCDTFGSESAEDAFATSMSDQLNLTGGDVEVLVCKEQGAKACTKTRRLGEERHLATGSEVEVNVQVSGEDAVAQMATLEAQMDSGLASTLTANAEEVAEGEVAEAATIAEAAATTGTSAGTTTGAAMVSSALHRRVSSSAVAVLLGSAWLGQ